MGIVAGGERVSETRVGVGWRVAVGGRGELVLVMPEVVGSSRIGKKGSYVGMLIGVAVEGAHEASKPVNRMKQTILCKGMGAILPVEPKMRCRQNTRGMEL